MRPSNLGIAVGGIALAAGLLGMFFPSAATWFWSPVFIAGLAAFVDFLLSLAGSAGNLERTAAGVMTTGHEHDVELCFRPPYPRGGLVKLFDGIPQDFEAPNLPLHLTFGKESLQAESVAVSYKVRPERRGSFVFVPAWIEIRSPLWFWYRRKRIGGNTPVKVFPDYRAIVGDHMFVGGSAHAPSGAHHIRRRGLGMEFHQLREYRQGDMMRTVDMKASSRFGKLIVREMQEEQDQSVLFLLDTGYRMTAKDAGKSHFDSGFEAMLSLAYVALKQGDRVGVRTWGPDHRHVPFFRGVAHFPQMVGKLYDIEAREEASSPAVALSEALATLTRRTFIVLLTNFREEDGEGVSDLIPLIGTRHLLCTVWMREKVAEEISRRVPRTHAEALETAMAIQYMRERERCKQLWEAKGVLTLDTAPEGLQAKLIEQYWNVKKQGRL